ncbi:MAG: MBL fold metallo-hydrolase [Phycisphaerales bacterium]|jgi:glyoxylase-like metal-dependent hydrolase (beta-lactamase superfamily II)
MDLRLISLGALAANPLWKESTPVRTGHATTVLLTVGNKRILVDPGLPEVALAARLHERAGIRPADVTDVFLTCFKPDMTRGLRLFDHARWWIHEAERESVGLLLGETLRRMAQGGDLGGNHGLEDDGPDPLDALKERVAQLRTCKPAPDRLADKVDLFPLPGATPGLCGLLVALPSHTLLICSDAVPDGEHLSKGRVLDDSADVERAKSSFAEAIEIADVLICGRDGMVINPTKRAF